LFPQILLRAAVENEEKKKGLEIFLSAGSGLLPPAVGFCLVRDGDDDDDTLRGV
jgi:hypothetical protein